MSVSLQNIAMPARKNLFATGPRGSKYDLMALEAGSNIAIVLDGDGSADAAKKNHSKLSSAVSNFRKTHKGTALENAQFTIRTFEGEAEDGSKVVKVGLWRVADKAPAAPADAPVADGSAA